MTVRTALSFSRDLEFANETELAKRMGCARRYWLRAALKELIDNALEPPRRPGSKRRRSWSRSRATSSPSPTTGPACRRSWSSVLRPI